jgi:hypothetical protein
VADSTKYFSATAWDDPDSKTPQVGVFKRDEADSSKVNGDGGDRFPPAWQLFGLDSVSDRDGNTAVYPAYFKARSALLQAADDEWDGGDSPAKSEGVYRRLE